MKNDDVAQVTDRDGRSPWWVELGNGDEGVLWAQNQSAAHADAAADANYHNTSYRNLRPATVKEARGSIELLKRKRRASEPYTWA